MKDIPTEELAAISPELHEAAVQVGCTHVNITGNIWPGAQASGRPEEAGRFAEFSWLRAAVINGRTIFENDDPKAYAELLVKYGLEDAPSPETPVPQAAEPKQEEAPVAAVVPPQPEKVGLTVEILPATKREMERLAKAEGISVSELLDWKFRPRIEG